MKIEKINLPQEKTDEYGLNPVKMDRLGEVVLLSGRNGSGKTRFLNLLSSIIEKYPTLQQYEDMQNSIENYRSQIESHEKSNETLNVRLNKLSVTDVNRKSFENDISSSHKRIENLQEQIVSSSKFLTQIDLLVVKPNKLQNHVIKFVPKSLNLQDGYAVSPQKLENEANLILKKGTEHIAQGTIPAIELVLKQYLNVTGGGHEDLSVSEEEVQKIKDDYTRLKEYIKIFLNTDLKRGKDGHGQIFGKRIGEAQLSDGQKILLQFCMALYAQEADLDNLVIIMDEPENHLHPAVLIEVLDKITQQVKNGQIWIATHSINILAHFDTSCIWYIDEGQISYAGNIPNKVLEGLLGPEDEIERVANFLALPAKMASTKFAFESLFYPDVAFTGKEDPQVAQIHEIINTRRKTGSKLKVLDFGIGKGRLISSIAENERARGSDVTEWLDYYGFDKYKDNKEFCVSILSSIYNDGAVRYFNSEEDCFHCHNKASLDLIVMCNVFHEIDPTQWPDLFNSPRSIFQLLKPDGYLLIVEDQSLAIGEKAHSKGFLVFDQMEFKELFDLKAEDQYHVKDYRGDGRLKAHHIPATCLSRITRDTRIQAIKMLMDTSKREIKSLRDSGDTSFKSGKSHGFWTQQLANASLALDEL